MCLNNKLQSDNVGLSIYNKNLCQFNKLLDKQPKSLQVISCCKNKNGHDYEEIQCYFFLILIITILLQIIIIQNVYLVQCIKHYPQSIYFIILCTKNCPHTEKIAGKTNNHHNR